MKFKENAKEATDLLKTVLPDLSKKKLVVNPYNYGLWYELYSSTNTEAMMEVERLLKEKGTLTPEDTLALYKKYVIDDLLTVDEKVGAEYTEVMTSMQEATEQTKASAGELEQELSDSLTAMDNVNSAEDLRKVVASVSRKTKKMQQSADDFGGVLDDAQKEIVRLKEELEEATKAANEDVLTGLYNRRYFDTCIAKALNGIHTGKSASLIIIDVDHFKKFNDTYGHLVGDVVLKAMARTLKSVCEGLPATPCRFGGEEFAILIVGHTKKAARVLAEKTRRAVSAMTVVDPTTNKKVPTVTCSIGVGFLTEKDNAVSFIERSDGALYSAKKSGRNQVVTS